MQRRYHKRRIRSALVRLVWRNDARTEFTIHARNDVLVLSGRLHISRRHFQQLPAVRSPKWLQFRAGYFVATVLQD